MLGSAGRTGSLEMSCGVSTWWEAEAQKSVGVCPQGGKVSVGRGAGVQGVPTPSASARPSALSSPSRRQLAQPQSHSWDFFFFFFCLEQECRVCRLAPLFLSSPHRPSWPTHLLGAWAWRLRVCGEQKWGEKEAPRGRSLLYLTPLTP